MRIKKYWLLGLFFITSHGTFAKFFGVNVFRPWDVVLRPDEWCGQPWQFTGYFERGLKTRGFNGDNERVNVLQIWTPTQDALAMLKGFPANSPETIFLENNLPFVEDNGIRGNFRVNGNFHLGLSGGFAARYYLCHDVILGAYLPVYAMRLNKVVFTDLTQNLNAQDQLVKENLTNNFFNVVHMFDPDLNLRGWHHAGIGDFAVTAEWLRYFPQQKPLLKNVGINLRVGLTIPTGKKENINEILSIPFGFDGSFSIFGDMGIILHWCDFVRGGINFEFMHLFGDTRLRRIKTQEDQTDFLFLAKAFAHTEYGFTQQYTLFLEAYRFFHGISFGFAYQFWKHSDDELALCTNAFSNAIANTAQNLQEWSIHQLIFSLKYDGQCDLDDTEQPIRPQLQLFYKMPFDGKRAILASTIGVAVTVNF